MVFVCFFPPFWTLSQTFSTNVCFSLQLHTSSCYPPVRTSAVQLSCLAFFFSRNPLTVGPRTGSFKPRYTCVRCSIEGSDLAAYVFEISRAGLVWWTARMESRMISWMQVRVKIMTHVGCMVEGFVRVDGWVVVGMWVSWAADELASIVMRDVVRASFWLLYCGRWSSGMNNSIGLVSEVGMCPNLLIKS